MGWILDALKFAERTKLKCERCGYEAPQFVSNARGLFVRCPECGAETEITAQDLKPQLNEPMKQIEQ